MWELFTLGKTPYPGMEASEKLYQLLLDGYRMDKPEFATQKIYNVMLSCWSTNPESRPLFDKLATIIGDLCSNLESSFGRPKRAENFLETNF